MFWKALVVTVWAGVVDGWLAYRKRLRDRGLPLRQNKAGVYVAYDWTESVQSAFRVARRFIYVVGAINMAFWVSAWIYVSYIRT